MRNSVMSPVEIMIWQSYIIQGLNVNQLRWNSNICMFHKITSKISLLSVTQEMLTLSAETWFGFWLGF